MKNGFVTIIKVYYILLYFTISTNKVKLFPLLVEIVLI